MAQHVTFNGKVYAGPRVSRGKGGMVKGGSVVTRDRARAVQMWRAQSVRDAETNHLAHINAISNRQYV